MSHEADAVAERPAGAQTVAPVQASALLFAASILGDASYTPDQELKGTLNTARTDGHPAPEPVAEHVAAPVVEEPVAESVAKPVAEPAPKPVAHPVAQPAAAQPAPERKGFFGRLLDKLFGRG